MWHNRIGVVGVLHLRWIIQVTQSNDFFLSLTKTNESATIGLLRRWQILVNITCKTGKWRLNNDIEQGFFDFRPALTQIYGFDAQSLFLEKNLFGYSRLLDCRVEQNAARLAMLFR